MARPNRAMANVMAPFLFAKLRAAIYVRKTNKKEGGSTKSREEQIAFCQMVASHYGMEVTDDRIYQEALGQRGEWFFDDGTGRYPPPYRPVLTRLMRDIEAGLIDCVLIWRSDRLFRDISVFSALAEVFKKHNVRFFCGTRELDLSSSSGMYQGSTEAANNRRWRDQTSEDIKRDHDFKAEMGMFTRDPTTIGYRSKGKGSQEVEVVWDEIAFVNRCFRLLIYGEGDTGPLGTNGVKTYLMDNGTKWPKGHKGHTVKYPDEIHESQLNTMYRNCMYISKWRHNGEEYDCPRLMIPVLDAEGNPTGEKQTAVPIDLYNKAQEKLDRAETRGRRNQGNSLAVPHLTTGLAVCSRCGRPLTVHFAHGKIEKGPRKGEPRDATRKFKCNHKRGHRPCPTGSTFGLQEDVLDAWVLTELAPVLVAEMEALRTSSAREKDTEDLSRLQRKLTEAKSRETKKLASLMDVLDAEQFAAIAAQLRGEREQLERQVRSIRDRLDRANDMMPDLDASKLACLPKAALKDALLRAVAWIAVGKAGTGVVVHTRWGSYIAAAYRKGDRERGEMPSKTFLSKPTPADTLNCTTWLPDPEEFVSGRRDVLGRAAESLTDEELLPGFFAEDEAVDVIEAPSKMGAAEMETETR